MPFAVRITANFDANLEAIRSFLVEQDADYAFDSLLDRLFDEIIPNLAEFPRIGRDFLALEPLSEQGRVRLQALRSRTRTEIEIREFIDQNYLILYALRRSTVFLLAIRHHRQLSFDVESILSL